MLKVIQLLVISSLFSHASFADTHMEEVCKNSITVNGSMVSKDDINFYKGAERVYTFGKSHTKGYFLSVFHNGPLKELSFQFRPYDLKEKDGKIYILFGHEIKVLDKNNFGVINTFKTSAKKISKLHELASELEVTEDKIYIAHGSLGLVVLKTEDGEVLHEKKFELPHSNSHISRATGIALQADRIYLAYDNVTYDFNSKKRAFEGLLISDLQLNRLKTTSIKVKREALHEPSLDIIDGMLVSQNLTNIYVYKMNNLMKDKWFWPRKRLYNFDGFNFLGNPYLENGLIKGCFSRYDQHSEEFQVKYNEVKY